MKFLLTMMLVPLCLLSVSASEYNIVRIPADVPSQVLTDAGFELFHRGGDYWIGSIGEDTPLPPEAEFLTEHAAEQGELFRLLLSSQAEAEKLSGKVEIIFSDSSEVIIRASWEQLSALPEIRAEWIHISTLPKPLHYQGIETPETDDFHYLVDEMVNLVSETEFTANVQALEDFTTRNTFTDQCDRAGDWIMEQFENYGLQTTADPFPIFGSTKYNIVAEIPGEVFPDSIIFVTSHYDATAGLPYSQEPESPGADDNGSGTGCVLECARILSQYEFMKTIRFIAFAGEEQGLFGSEDYVQDLLAAGANVVGSFNYDMIGWSGSDPLPRDLVIHADFNPLSQAMAAKLEEAILTFVPDDIEPIVTIDPGAGSSDHGPFWDAGYPAIEGIEAAPWGPEFNPYYHSVNDLLSNLDIPYAVNVTRAAVAALADYAIPYLTTGPALLVTETSFEEIEGNGNNLPDAGEILSLEVTLINVGVDPATGVNAVFSSIDTNIIIGQSNIIYPDLQSQQSAPGNQEFEFTVSPDCPQQTTIFAEISMNADGGYSYTIPFVFMVYEPYHLPSGPDAYGYYAYDMNDGEMAPDYDWQEIAPFAGGTGTPLAISTNQTIQMDLPFSFRFYGQDNDRISICSNGWMAFGETFITIPVNLAIPHFLEPDNFAAPFWDALVVMPQSQVCQYYDQQNHTFIVEWYDLQFATVIDQFATFQAVLYDPEFYPTETGDGEIVFNYHTLDDPDWCTTGIENASGTSGFQYCYNSIYYEHASPLGSESALRFTTEGYVSAHAPYDFSILSPADGDTVSTPQVIFIWEAAVDPDPGQTPYYEVWIDTLSDMSTKWQIAETLPDTSFEYSGLAENRIYYWDVHAGDINSLGTWAGSASFVYSPAVSVDDLTGSSIVETYYLEQNYPNPFNPETSIGYYLKEDSRIKLEIFNIAGQKIMVLAEGIQAGGVHRAVWNSESFEAASGIYIYRLTAEGRVSGEAFRSCKKMILMK